MADQTRHLQHEQVRQAVRDWFRQPFEEMGYRNEVRLFGVYWSTGMVFPSPAAIASPADFLSDLQTYYGHDDVVVCLDDPALEEQLGPELAAAGWIETESDMFLAHVGQAPGANSSPEIILEPVSEANLREFALMWLVSFADVESTPDEQTLEQQMARRRQELAGTGRGLVARFAGEAAGIMSWFDDPLDIWIRGLAVRPAFRGRGIGSALVKQRVVDGYAAGKRSHLINVALQNSGARRLYGRLGFHDEVYRRRQFAPPK